MNACFWDLPLLYILVEKNLKYSGRDQNPTAYHLQKPMKTAQMSCDLLPATILTTDRTKKRSDPSFCCKALYKWENIWRPKTPLTGDIKQICNLTNKQL